jgi:oligopeptide/dipeptide ABC transporter ATP-binding protein
MSDHITLLEIEDLSAVFTTDRGLVHAVDSVSVVVERGRTLGVVGESGSGKSVLCRSIMGLDTRRGVALAGSVRFEGAELVGMPLKGLRRFRGTEMAMVFQDPMTSLNPVVRIGRQITESLQVNLGQSREQATQTALELLHAVDIPSPERRLRQYPYELSGGMRQRVVIAIALACKPKLLLADEPTTALDVTVQAQILQLLADLRERSQMAMILVTHDLGIAATMTDEIVVMYAGQVVERAPTRALFRETKMPYTEALMQSHPKLDTPRNTRLQAIPGQPPARGSSFSGCRFAPRCRYVQPRCKVDAPPLTGAGGGHFYRCWFPEAVSAHPSIGARDEPQSAGN